MSARLIGWSVFAAILALLLGLTLVTRNAATLQVELYSKLESKFGFTTKIVTTNLDNNQTKAVAIHPAADGLLYQAGFREGDVLTSYSRLKFYGLLQEKKGSSVFVEVVDKDGVGKTLVLDIPD